MKYKIIMSMSVAMCLYGAARASDSSDQGGASDNEIGFRMSRLPTFYNSFEDVDEKDLTPKEMDTKDFIMELRIRHESLDSALDIAQDQARRQSELTRNFDRVPLSKRLGKGVPKKNK